MSWRNTAEAAKFKSSEALKIDSNVYETVEKRARLGEYDVANIVCRHKVENELFITSEGKVWLVVIYKMNKYQAKQIL